MRLKFNKLQEHIASVKDGGSLERLKLTIECNKVRVERAKMWVMAISVFVPLLVGAGGLYYAARLEDQRARAVFQVKAAEIVLNANTPTAGVNKAKVLAELFPDRLPADFVSKMEKMYGNERKETKRR